MSAEENETIIRRLIVEFHNQDNQDALVIPDVCNYSAVPEHKRGFEPVV